MLKILLLLSCLSTSSQAAPFYFLSDSKILKEQNIRLIPPQIHEGRVFVQLLEEKSADQKKWLLNATGELIPLRGSGITNDVDIGWPCDFYIVKFEPGEYISGSELFLPKKKAATGHLIAIGDNVEEVLTWHPFKKIAPVKDADCTKPADDTNQTSLSFFSSTGLRKNEILFFSESNPKVKQSDFSSTSRLGRIGQKNDCQIWITDYHDGDGQSRFQMRKPLGMLILKSGKEEETWLILHSRGTESWGFMGVPYDPSLPPTYSEISYLHHNGVYER